MPTAAAAARFTFQLATPWTESLRWRAWTAPQGGVQLDDGQLAAWIGAATVEHASAAQAAWLWQWLREPSTAAEREAVAAGGCCALRRRPPIRFAAADLRGWLVNPSIVTCHPLFVKHSPPSSLHTCHPLLTVALSPLPL